MQHRIAFARERRARAHRLAHRVHHRHRLAGELPVASPSRRAARREETMGRARSVATLTTIVLARRSTRVEAWIAAGVTLTVVSHPAAAEPHFVLLGIPLALRRLSMTEFMVIAALLLVPLEFTAERSTTGWAIFLAYPRL